MFSIFTIYRIFIFLFSIRPPSGLLTVLGPLERYRLQHLMWPCYCIIHRDGVITISSWAGADLGRTLINRPWWPSGLRQHAISQLIVAPEGLVRIPLEAKIYMVAICTHYNSLPTEYDIDRPESEITCHYSNSRAPGNLRLLTISTQVRPL